MVLGFSVGLEAFDELLLINVSWIQEFSVFSGFGLKPPASSFQSYSYSSLKTSPSIQHIDKTFRLMVKQFSTVRDTQRGSQSYMEKREEGVRGDPNEMRRNQKRRDQASQ